MKTLNILILGLAVALSACGKKTSNNDAGTPYTGYQQPQFAPPTNNWNSYNPSHVPTGNCGQFQTLPATCYGTYNGYNYCGNQWYYYWNSTYWAFPAFGSCGNTGNNHHNDDWYDDDDNSDDWSSDDDDVAVNTNYNSGWKKIWGVMGSSENKYVIVTVPKDATYFVSFKGNYTGKSQKHETLSVKFQGGTTRAIDDLNQTHTGSSEVTQSCKVNVNYKLEGGESYKIYLSGDDDSVNDTYLRLTSYWPSDVTKLCH